MAGSVLAAPQVAHQLRERQEGPGLAGLLLHGAAVRQRLPADPGAASVFPHLLRQRHAHQDGCHWGRVPEGGGRSPTEPSGGLAGSPLRPSLQSNGMKVA